MLTDVFQYLITGILLGGIYGVMSMGLSMVVGVMGLINFAHGALMMLAMYFTYFFWLILGFNPIISFVLVLPIFFLFGALIERGLISRVIGKPKFSALVLTLGISVILTNMVQVFWTGDYRSIIGYGTQTFVVASVYISKAELTAFVLSLSMAFILSVFLSRSDFGKAIRATADDREVAMFMGIDVGKIYLVTFGIATALAAGAGALVSTFYPIFPGVWWNFIFLMFVAIVLGGLGSIKGSFIGGLVIGIAQSLSALFLPIDLNLVPVFVIFLIVLIVLPHGLYGKKSESEAKGV